MPLKKPEVSEETKKEVQEDSEVKVTKKTAPEVQEDSKEGTAKSEPSKEVSTSVTQGGGGGMKEFLEEQREAGFDLDVNSFSFNRIKLDDGRFLYGSEEKDLGENFKFRPLSSKKIYIIRQSDDNEAEMFYSYSADGSTKIDGSSAKETLDEWKEDGFGTEDSPLDIKPYLEVLAELMDNGMEEDGEIVSLSIPPSSKSRFGGLAVQAKFKFNAGMSDVICEATVGGKVGTGNKSFRPWNFSVKSLV